MTRPHSIQRQSIYPCRVYDRCGRTSARWRPYRLCRCRPTEYRLQFGSLYWSTDLELIYESGVYGAQPARQPLSIGDPTLVTGATSVISMADLFGLYLQGGLVEVALLGGAQIDRFGNLNTTVIGSYTDPKVRLPGSGGACEIAIRNRHVYIIMHLKSGLLLSGSTSSPVQAICVGAQPPSS